MSSILYEFFIVGIGIIIGFWMGYNIVKLPEEVTKLEQEND